MYFLHVLSQRHRIFCLQVGLVKTVLSTCVLLDWVLDWQIVYEVGAVAWVRFPAFRSHYFYHSIVFLVLLFYFSHIREKVCEFFFCRVQDRTRWNRCLSDEVKIKQEIPSSLMWMRKKILPSGRRMTCFLSLSKSIFPPLTFKMIIFIVIKNQRTPRIMPGNILENAQSFLDFLRVKKRDIKKCIKIHRNQL